MSFSSVPTVATGDVWSAANHNQYIKDNMAALWVGSAAGDMDYYTSATGKSRFAKGTAYQTLRMNSGATAPEWATPRCDGAEVLRTTDQSVNNASYTFVSFDSEIIDANSYYSAAAPTKFTIPKDGLYLINFAVSHATNATGVREIQIFIDGTAAGLEETKTSSTGVHSTTQITRTVYLQTNNYIECAVWQNSGGALNILGLYIHGSIVFLGV